VGLFHIDGILVTFNSRINADAENVLVVLSQYAVSYHISVVGLLSGVNVHNTDNTCCPRLNGNATGLVEFVGKDVFIVGQRDDKLNN
jgi:hypothetical protein